MTVPHTIQLRLQTENLLIPADIPTQRVLEVRLIAPPKANVEKRLAMNLSLVVDHSGSMHGAKLENVKQAATHVLDLLDENDRISMITFDDRVSIISESTRVTPVFKDELKRRVWEIKSGGTTNLSGGWLVGCEQVAQQLSKDGRQVDRTLLLTDGLANVGITDVEELGVHARELAGRGVSTSTFGVGEGFNEQLLEVMANLGQGNFTYIVSPMDIPDIFAREFSELMAITARDVEINLLIPADVGLTILGNWRCEKTGIGSTRISLGSLGASQEKSLFVDLVLPPGTESQSLSMHVSVRGRSESGEILESKADLSFIYTGQQALEAAQVDKDVLERAALARISHIARKALDLERNGKARAAADMLMKAIEDNKDLDDSARQTYERTARHMQAGMEESDRKTSHYQAYLHSHQRMDAHFHLHTQPGGSDSVDLLRKLLGERSVRIKPGPLLWETLPGLVSSFSFDKVEGMLLGLAIGDALGNTSEGMLPAERQAAFGKVMGYLPNPKAGGQPVGLPSDDTQMAFWTLEVLLQEGKLNPDLLARRFTRERIFGIGSTVKEFIRAYKDQGRGWKKSGRESAGNGALMRIAPILLPYLSKPKPGMAADAVLAGMLTHNDYASNAACVAFTRMLWELLCMHTPPPREWWGETYYRLAAPLEGKTNYTPRMSNLSYRGPIANFVRQGLEQAIGSGWTTLRAGNSWGSGAYLMETLPTAFYILARHAEDPERAILRAVNNTKDNDTLASIVGAAVGALHGKSALPARWISGLLGRTNAKNDGHIFGLIEKTKMQFGKQPL